MEKPFRWDLVKPDHLGSLLEKLEPADLWFADELAVCAGKMLARSNNGKLIFVGRSLDSMFDLVSGALHSVDSTRELLRLPLSFAQAYDAKQLAKAREFFKEIGCSPAQLARRTSPVVFVDVVASGNTFEEIFTLLKNWTEEVREAWAVVRMKICFVGITWRRKTSPNTWRWQQNQAWPKTLPKQNIVNVSIEGSVWNYLGNTQRKINRSYTANHWLNHWERIAPDTNTRIALAEAVALVNFGKSKQCRTFMARAMDKEPALKEPWLRALQASLVA